MRKFKEMPMPAGQTLLFSHSVDEALPQQNDVRGFNDVMECLDYSDIINKCSERGCPPYPPKVMVKVLAYAYSKGLRSSRAIEEALKVDVRFIWLAGGLKPDHNTLARFRKDNWEFLGSLFRDSVRVCAEAGLVSLSVVAVDGSKIRARASKKRVYSQRKLDRHLAEVDRILAEAEEVDRSEDEAYKDGACGQLPEHLRDATERKAKLEQIANRLRDSKRKSVVETDPDSRVMKTGDGLKPGYNLQAAVDADSQIIVASELIQAEDDHGELPGMVEDVERNLGVSPGVVMADCGYADEATLLWIEDEDRDVLMPLQEHQRNTDPNDLFASKCFLAEEDRDVLICPAGRELKYRCDRRIGGGTYRHYAANGCLSCTLHQDCVGDRRESRRVSIGIAAKPRQKMLERLRSEDGKRLYSRRQSIVEPVFGQMKANQGFDRLVCWGLEGAKAESALMFLAHNVMKCVANAAARAYVAAAIAANSLVFSLLSGFCRLRTLRTCRS